MSPATDRPWRNDARNDPRARPAAPGQPCPICGTAFAPRGRQRLCSAACRQKRWRQQHPPAAPTLPVRVPRGSIVYECPACEQRYLGQQRCDDCQQFCRRVGPGGPCPHCDEPVAMSDLVPDGIAGRTA